MIKRIEGDIPGKINRLSDARPRVGRRQTRRGEFVMVMMEAWLRVRTTAKVTEETESVGAKRPFSATIIKESKRGKRSEKQRGREESK